MQSKTLNSVSESPACAAAHVLFIAASAAGHRVNVGCSLWYVFTSSMPGLLFTPELFKLHVAIVAAATQGYKNHACTCMS